MKYYAKAGALVEALKNDGANGPNDFRFWSDKNTFYCGGGVYLIEIGSGEMYPGFAWRALLPGDYLVRDADGYWVFPGAVFDLLFKPVSIIGIELSSKLHTERYRTMAEVLIDETWP